MKKDRLYARPLKDVAGFEFNQQVTEVFDDMIDRSVPFYQQTLWLIAEIAYRFYQKETQIIDLGSSTGGFARMLSERFTEKEFHYLGVDNSASMIAEARKRFSQQSGTFKFVEEDIIGTAIDNASVVVANYTIQFIRPLDRLALFQKIYNGLSPQGVFILSEKVLERSSESSQLFSEIHLQFKKNNGYSDLEIAQKRDALENVLQSYRIDEYIALLNEAGFCRIDIAFKWANFATLVAVKA